jgi:DNA-binding NarL/FixJ family response regulator
MDQAELRLLLADDHDVVRKGVRSVLEIRRGWRVCGEANNGGEAVKLAIKLKPDIAVLDLEMPVLNGLEATKHIKRERPEVEILIFTMHDTEYLIREVLGAGARAYVLKTDGARKLVEAIEAVSKHKPFLTTRASETLLDNLFQTRTRPNELSVLTDRERETVRLVAEGKSNKEIAAELVISVKTVETHRAAVMRKLGFTSIVSLVRFAVRNNLIRP